MSRRGREDGATSIEMALYMPIFLLAIFVTVQFSLMYLGDRAAQAVAREAARVARAGAGSAQAIADARARGQAYAAVVGKGVLFNPRVDVVLVSANEVRATVRGTALTLAPGIAPLAVDQSVQGPVESFRADTP